MTYRKAILSMIILAVVEGFGHVPRLRNFHTDGIAANLKGFPQTTVG